MSGLRVNLMDLDWLARLLLGNFFHGFRKGLAPWLGSHGSARTRRGSWPNFTVSRTMELVRSQPFRYAKFRVHLLEYASDSRLAVLGGQGVRDSPGVPVLGQFFLFGLFDLDLVVDSVYLGQAVQGSFTMPVYLFQRLIEVLDGPAGVLQQLGYLGLPG